MFFPCTSNETVLIDGKAAANSKRVRPSLEEENHDSVNEDLEDEEKLTFSSGESSVK